MRAITVNRVLQALLPAGILVIATAALAQSGPGNPLGGRETGLSKKPGGIAAMGMSSGDINKELGAPNTNPQSSGFTVTSVSTVPLTSESVWSYSLKVNTPYAWNAQQSTWSADDKRMGEVKVFRHIGFDKSGKAVIDVMRVVNRLGQGVEITSAIRGMTAKGGLFDGLEVYADDPTGTRSAEVSSLATAASTAARLIPLAPNGLPRKYFTASASDILKPILTIAKGKERSFPCLVLAEGWEVNPVGVLGPQVPAGISPLLWTGTLQPATGGKDGGISVQAGTVPGVDIIIKKCPCGIIATGSVGVATNASWIAVGAFDEKRLREAAQRTLEARVAAAGRG